MKNRQDVVAFIVKLEHQFPVDEWTIDGFHLWPLLRIRLYIHLIRKVETSLNTETKSAEKATPNNSPDNVKFSAVHKIIKRFKTWQRYIRLQKKEFLFAEALTHRSVFNGKSYSKFFDPILDQIGNRKGIILEHTLRSAYDGLPLFQSKRVHFLSDIDEFVYEDLSERKKVWLEAFQVVELKDFEAFRNVLSENPLSADFAEKHNENNIRYMTRKFREYSLLYSKILDRVQPKVVFSVCFYNFHMMVLNYLANKRGIKTVEIQHGPQPNIHLGYASWTKVPKKGFNTMPEYFWNWNETSRSTIDNWASNTKHKSIIGGNPWVQFFNSNDIHSIEEKGVLYSLQHMNLSYLFRHEVVELIKQNPQETWWIRIHPGQKDQLPQIMAILKEVGLDNKVFVEEPSALPLPSLLAKTKLHLTHFSGCSIEAEQFNIPTVFLDERGVKTFPELVHEGKGKFAPPPFQLTDILFDEFKGTKTIHDYRNIIKGILNETKTRPEQHH